MEGREGESDGLVGRKRGIGVSSHSTAERGGSAPVVPRCLAHGARRRARSSWRLSSSSWPCHRRCRPLPRLSRSSSSSSSWLFLGPSRGGGSYVFARPASSCGPSQFALLLGGVFRSCTCSGSAGRRRLRPPVTAFAPASERSGRAQAAGVRARWGGSWARRRRRLGRRLGCGLGECRLRDRLAGTETGAAGGARARSDGRERDDWGGRSAEGSGAAGLPVLASLRADRERASTRGRGRDADDGDLLHRAARRRRSRRRAAVRRLAEDDAAAPMHHQLMRNASGERAREEPAS